MGFRGFTLVEMLVAVALVLLMMTLFAQVFQMAGGTITTQRGIAENDQRSRTVQNILKGDLDKRSFRLVMPWATGEDGSLVDTAAVDREGYFYYSENDPLNDTDDVLQFTINVNTRVKNPDTTALFGKATSGATWNSSGNILSYLRNQPEADDGWSTTNGTAEGPAAEVVYFIRGGKLYRRVLLIRPNPWGTNGESQPSYVYNNTLTYDLFDYTVPPPMGGPTPYPDPLVTTGISFWNDFDHSAFPVLGVNNSNPTDVCARFHSVDDLSNASTLTQYPLGRPQFRFGHRSETVAGTVTGRPREFDSPDGSNVVRFFGRFTHEETSDSNFHHPHGRSTALSGTIDPMVGSLTLNTTTNVFPDFVGGLRRGEDLLLSNVHSFDVKVWDAGALGGAGAFVDIGRTAAAADPTNPQAVNFSVSGPDNRSNSAYGPINPSSAFAAPYNVNRVFDTWHPDCNLNLDGIAGDDPPPFRHVIYGAGTPNNSEWGVAVGQSPNLGVKQKPTWLASTTYAPGDFVFPTSTNRRANGLRFVYRCVNVVGTPSTARTEPGLNEWPAVSGARLQDGTATDNYVWEAVDNWKPLRAIQITIRYHDVTSDQMRQQTIVHSLVD